MVNGPDTPLTELLNWCVASHSLMSEIHESDSLGVVVFKSYKAQCFGHTSKLWCFVSMHAWVMTGARHMQLF